jgi:DNA-directed RNA polymerase specialized sigma subunit
MINSGCQNTLTKKPRQPDSERSAMNERKKEMLNLRKKYWTLQMIGRKYGVSRQRVAQIIGRTGKISEMIEKKQGGVTTTA